ncbi:MAG: ribose-5-phosphate isomerase RpiA [Gammaproteobacteria bacterium]|nr:ribose-5-phosphate isomerase RpiA [Gammaproteobacteria bacterium]MCH9744399.1 ribose-5-phosphate isomerase RpiA [Gammaproteobacteria bacterium]
MKSKQQDKLKQQVAAAALEFAKQHDTIGVGTGSTVNYFIEALSSIKNTIDVTIASSTATEKLLKKHGFAVVDLNTVSKLPIYIDGADEFNQHLCLVKGGGGALTREKIIAASADQFVCITDSSKKADVLGRQFAIPIEVIPMARGYVAREIVKLGGSPEYREGFKTDNGNIILDIHNFEVLNPVEMEQRLNNITGVVTNGLFAQRKADVVLMADATGIQELS